MTWKKWAKRTALAVAAALAVRTAWLVGEREWVRAGGTADLARAVAGTEAADPGWRWDDLAAARRVPPGPERGRPRPRVKALLPPEWVRPLGPEPWEPTPPPLAPNRPPPDDILAAARARSTAGRAAVDLARALADYRDGHRPVDLAPDVLSTRLQDTQDTGSVSVCPTGR